MHQPSNTLIVSQILDDATEFKPYYREITLKKFKFSLYIYESTAKAKEKYDSLSGKYHISYYLYTDLNWFSGSKIVPLDFLQIPTAEKNFLISPPGDPPLGWTQDLETKPSPGGFTVNEEEGREHFIKSQNYADLVDFKLDADPDVELQVNLSADGHVQEIVTYANISQELNLPIIVIDHVPGDLKRPLKIPQTALPPPASTAPVSLSL